MYLLLRRVHALLAKPVTRRCRHDWAGRAISINSFLRRPQLGHTFGAVVFILGTAPWREGAQHPGGGRGTQGRSNTMTNALRLFSLPRNFSYYKRSLPSSGLMQRVWERRARGARPRSRGNGRTRQRGPGTAGSPALSFLRGRGREGHAAPVRRASG